MRTLTFSTLYPNSAQPRHGIFNEQRVRHLVSTGEVESLVLAPTPWFPFGHPCFGRYGTHGRIPAEEERHGLRVLHPRYPLLPKMSMCAAPLLLAAAVRPVVEELLGEGYDFDLIDAQYLYPDVVAQGGQVIFPRSIAQRAIVAVGFVDLGHGRALDEGK